MPLPTLASPLESQTGPWGWYETGCSFLLLHLPGPKRHLGNPGRRCPVLPPGSPHCSWRLVLGGYSSVQGEQAGSEERGSAQGRVGTGPLCLG